MQVLGIECFDQVYEIMEEAFPREERRSYEEQKALLKRKDYHICGIVKNGKVLTFLAYYEVRDFYFIEHLATHRTTRGSGIGKELLLQCLHALDKDIIFEVEKPTTNIAERRIHFYERLGCHLYSKIPYVQPAFYKDALPLSLYLMSWPHRMQQDVMKQRIRLIYQDVYRVKKITS